MCQGIPNGLMTRETVSHVLTCLDRGTATVDVQAILKNSWNLLAKYWSHCKIIGSLMG